MKKLLTIILTLAYYSPCLFSQSTNLTPEEILNKSLAAMGGKDKIENVKSLHLKGMEIDNLYSIAVQDKGAIPKMFWEIDRVLDFKNEKLVNKGRIHFNFRQDDVQFGFIYNPDTAMQEVGDKKLPASLAQLKYFKEELHINPVYIFQQGIKTDKPMLLDSLYKDGVKYFVIEFPVNGIKTKVIINSLNFLPAVIEYTRYKDQDNYNNFWGDETTKITYSGWTLTPSGIKFPTRWIYDSEGFPMNDVSFTEVEMNPVVPADTFKIPEKVKEAFLKQKPKNRMDFAKDNNNGNANLVAKGIYQSPGIETKYNSTIVEQSDGLVIIDAPFSSANSEIVIKKAKELFPDKTIKAVISSNQLWMHIAGLREYAAEGVPIYLYKENKNIVEKLMNANYFTVPDNLQKNKKEAVIKTISSRMNLGEGENRIEIIPVRTGTGQRTLAVYFPGKKLLYASDLYQPKRFARNFWSFYVSEVRDFIEREKLDVEKVFSLHMTPIKYSDL